MEGEALIAYVDPHEVTTKASAGEWVVVDVRDEDRSVGWVPGSVHVPSESLSARVMENFLLQYTKPPHVLPNAFVFHCMYSKQRGPRAAQLCVAALSALQNRGLLQSVSCTPRVLIMRGGYQGYAKHMGLAAPV